MRPLSLCLLFTLSCATASPIARAPSAVVLGSAAGAHDARLAGLLRRHWDWRMRLDPVWATQLGDHRFDDRLDDHSAAAEERAHAEERAFLDEAHALDGGSLSPADRVHLQLFEQMLEGDIAGWQCHFNRWAVSTFFNGVLSWNELPEQHPVRSLADGQHLLARYRQLPRIVDEDLANLARGLKEGRSATVEAVRRVVAQVNAQLAEPDLKWALMAPAREPHEGWSESQRRHFGDEIAAAVHGSVRPAYTRYLQFLESELLPRARSDEHAGVGALPDGARCYEAMIRYHTGLAKNPAELHQLGLDEMARIHGQMRQIAARLFHSEDLPAAFDKLRNDPAFRFATADEIVAKAQSSLDAARAAIPRFFGVLPRTACVVKKIPSYEAAYSTIAYYHEPQPGDGKPGEYRVNVSAPETRPRHEAAVLAFHESIPGHHLQIALAQELPEMPAFRRYLGLTAFVEGWGLYSERLAGEMGLYADDSDKFGMLDYDAWRASRLVVDTGLHAMGWSRQQAIDYMKTNTALAENNIINEVDRYIAAPGQALAYKVGQLEILRLRHEAETSLGDRFDIKGFHDAVLGGGAVSLGVLADQIHSWVKSR